MLTASYTALPFPDAQGGREPGCRSSENAVQWNYCVRSTSLQVADRPYLTKYR
jgi:hypothetical protein